MKLKIMTYNIYSGKNLAKELNVEFAASVIRGVQPAFVTLNEVRCRTADVGPIDQSNEIGRLTGYYPVFGKAIDVLGGDYGNAILTRLPLLEHEVIHIPDPETRAYTGHYEHRVILRCVLDAGEKKLTVLCTHFGLNSDEQQLAVKAVLDIAAKESNPVLLMGDLNLTPDAPELKPLYEVFEDTCALDPSILTFPSDVPKIKIDYIFYTKPVKAESVVCLDTQNSDHRPLIAEISF